MQSSKNSLGTLIIVFSLLLTSCGRTASPASQINTGIPNVVIPTAVACVTVASNPTPGPDTPSIFPVIAETDHIRGSNDALITIMDYSDYQDPRSAALAEVTKRLLEENPTNIRLVSRPFPVHIVNDKAAYAALAAEAAAEQDKFWQMHDLLFEEQANWINLSVDDFKHWLTVKASDLGLDSKQFKSDYAREDIIAKVQKAWEDGTKINLPGTPVVILNGELYQGPRDYTSLNDIIQLIILGERQFSTCPPITVDTKKQYLATLKTERGNVVLQLFPDKAPVTVNSFVFLARNGWYDNITFHRVIPDLFAQTGDPSGSGKGTPGYYVITEITRDLTFNRPGMVAMVNSGPDTSGSQFFITYAPTAQYDGNYTIFGQVLSGMDVLQSLTARNAQPGAETPPGDKLISVTIEER
jgi:cyclophilin family peptidyl-prolyl cis-trans isomerase/protein-disulfide isomerase